MRWPSAYSQRAEKLAREGLYDPRNEHDACGVGMVAAIDGKPRREIVEGAIAALKSVWHRGAVDADGKTGDGAGIHIQIPRSFFESQIAQMGKPLQSGKLAVGMVFLPKKNLRAQEECRAIVEQQILKLGYHIYGWRQVPINPTIIGEIANDSRPEIEQILISSKSSKVDDAAFERDLYLIRRRIEKQVQQRAIGQFYIASLSCRTIIYKGLFKAEQLTEFFPDLLDTRFESNFAIFHQRFSTNTEPAWNLAQPFRVLAHNGEINTLKGNLNHMKSHEATMDCEFFRGIEEDLRPVVPDNTSDTGALDAVMELLVRSGHPVPLTKLILVPPAWGFASEVPQHHKDMYNCLNTVSEPWDGPAALAATDGNWVVAGMDRNGLRPVRYAITNGGMLLLGSESGMVPFNELEVVEKGKLAPGEMIGIDLAAGKLFKDRELKDSLAAQHPYAEWSKNAHRLTAQDMDGGDVKALLSAEELKKQQLAIGMTFEDLELVLQPMGETGKEPVGSMGDDTPLAMLSSQPRGFHHYFRQNFSQVTNPPIDPLRERRTMSLVTRFGNDGNYLSLDNSHHTSLVLESPVLLTHELGALKKRFPEKITQVDVLFDTNGGGNALRRGIDTLLNEVDKAVAAGRPYIVLTDENRSEERAGIPMILATAAVNSHLVRRKLRKRCSLIVRSAECFDVHHFAVLIGVGATVVNAYLSEETLIHRHAKGLFKQQPIKTVLAKFKESADQGILKIMSKMGISVVSAYRNGYNFECIGLSRSLVSEFFPGLPSRLSGIGLEGIEKRVLSQHRKAYESSNVVELPVGGFYRYRAKQEAHALEGPSIHTLQTAVTKGSFKLFKEYAESIYAQPPITLRQLLDFNSPHAPIDMDRVEPITEIRKRFAAPAMSHGALSREAHETLAIAMNRMGAMCNSGEGGEGEERFKPYANGDNPNSNVKQVASARFGVTAKYLNACTELQIKVAQGAKPGEGGQLPGFKVTAEIARLRHATEGVMLISPPPHHDIYSIEDLAQLIYDLKQINPDAKVSVKLVSQAGIGTVASGVAKAMADKIIIAGHSGGTGASPLSSIKFAGSPWEMGLAEVNQVLTMNRLRHRVRLQTDGGIKTGRDVVIAAMLGAEEFGVGTAALVAMGCLMVRQCHMNTCPVGICTQDPALRAKFDGSVEKVINLYSFIAEEVREILAQLGFEKLEDVIGRTDLLRQTSRGGADLVDLDLNPILATADAGFHKRYCTMESRNEVPDTLDEQMLKDAKQALETGEKIQLAYTVHNTHRTIGARLSSMLARHYHTASLAEDHITIQLRGSAGQSLGAFLERGITLQVLGDANDYVGKGLSGGKIVLRPRTSSKLLPHENVIIGNTVLYGATSGSLYAAGIAGERFAVRNSGANAVIEGCGSNGCEYMTGGTAVILGAVGDNFAAGMTGGMAFVYDEADKLALKINAESVVTQRIASRHWEAQLKALLEAHVRETDSTLAQTILTSWEYEREKFWQVCPKEMVDRLAHPLTEAKAQAKKA